MNVKNVELDETIRKLTEEAAAFQKERDDIRNMHNVVLANYSSFVKTAKAELARKNGEIDRLRKE